MALLLERAPEPNRAWAWVRDGRVELVAQLCPFADTSTPTIASSRTTSVAVSTSSCNVAAGISAREASDERAAILEYNTGFSQADAERRVADAVKIARPADHSASPTTRTDDTTVSGDTRSAR